MPPADALILGLLVGAALISYVLTGRVRVWAVSTGAVSIPNERSSHHQPVPLGAGWVIMAVPVTLLAFFALIETGQDWSAVVTFGGAAVAVVGVSWLDDRYSLSRVVRGIVHVGAAVAAIVSLGYWHSILLPAVGTIQLGNFGLVVTAVWIVGMVNAYNFIDGIDGLAGSQAIIAGSGWFVLGLLTGQPVITTLGGLLAAASAGFVLHNWFPARIFMGDAGSAFLGYAFAFITLWASRIHPVLVFAGVLLVWPVIFDPLFTVVRRLRRRESILTGHRSFLFHRMLLSGLSQVTVTMRYIFLALVGATLAIAWSRGLPGVRIAMLALAPALCIVLWLLVLFQEQKNRSATAGTQGPNTARSLAFEYILPRARRYALPFLRDALIVALSYVAAALLRFDGHIPSRELTSLAENAPAAGVIFVTALYLFSVHRISWTLPSLYDIRVTVDACLVASMVLTFGDIVIEHHHILSLTVVIVGSLLALLGLLGVRIWKPLLHAYESPAPDVARVLIVGAGRTGQVAALAMLGDPDLRQRPVGFLDDDRNTHEMRVHGVLVYGSIDQLPALVHEQAVDSILIAIPNSAPGLASVMALAAQTGLPVRTVGSTFTTTSHTTAQTADRDAVITV